MEADDALKDAVSQLISSFTVGFLTLSVHGGIEEGSPAGSGCLVRVGSVFGIMTAAHVLEHLPDIGHIGLVRFQYRESRQRQTIDMELASKIIIGGERNGKAGPDIGFLRLPPSNVGALDARNVFFNLDRGRAALRAPVRMNVENIDAVVGAVAEWSGEEPGPYPDTRISSVQGLFGIGSIVAESRVDDFDIFDFEVSYEPGFPRPKSYAGMSGGALWRLSVSEDAQGRRVLTEKSVIGVAFYETPTGGAPIITCHGPASVYDVLLPKIRERWPEES